MKLEKQIQFLEQITGKKVVLEDTHECHCGGSCCTDKKPLNENSQVVDLAWEALSALEIVRQKIARAIEIEPSDNLGDASRYVDAAYRSLKPLEVSETTLKEDYRDEKENIQILKNIAKLAKANPKSRKLQNMGKEALQIYKSFKAGRFNNSLENSLDEEVEMLLDNYSPIPKGIVPYETLGGLRD